MHTFDARFIRAFFPFAKFKDKTHQMPPYFVIFEKFLFVLKKGLIPSPFFSRLLGEKGVNHSMDC